MIVKYGNENGSITDAPNVRRNLGPSNCIAQPAHLPVRVLIVSLSIECLSVSKEAVLIFQYSKERTIKATVWTHLVCDMGP